MRTTTTNHPVIETLPDSAQRFRKLFNLILVLGCILTLIASEQVEAAKRKARKPKPAQQTSTIDEESGAEDGSLKKGDKDCAAEILIEAMTGRILYEYNANEPLPPASMIKMMTAFVAMKLIQEGKADLSDIVTASAAASHIGGSQIYLKQGEQFTLEQLLKAIMISSANDAAYAVAEHLGGSISGYLDLMHHEAEVLGMKNTRFYSVHGLPPAKGQEADVASAHDMALLGRAIILQTPQLLEYSSIKQEELRDGKFIMHNVNKMLGVVNGLDGIKTGYYRQAGFCITASALRKNQRYIAVVMGCATKQARANETARLFNLGFNMFDQKELAQKDAPYGGSIPVINGVKPEVGIVFSDDLLVIIPRADVDKIQTSESLTSQTMEAPIKAGIKVGQITFFIGDQELGTVDLLTAEAIERMSLFQKFVRWFGL